MIEQSEPRILQIGDQVKVRASGQYGLVERISPHRRHWPVLVKHQDGGRAYGPDELWYVTPSTRVLQPCAVQPCAVQQEASDVD